MKNLIWGLALLLQSIWPVASYSQVWNREFADSSGNDLGTYCNIALDPSDNPVIVHMDADFVDLRMLNRNNNQWSMQIIDTSGYTGWSAGLVIDDNGKPHICFENGALVLEPVEIFGVNYMTLEQDEWIKEAIEKCDFHLPLSSTHIALTSGGTPVVGYYNINDGYFYLAFKRDGDWIRKKSPYSKSAVRLRLKSDDTPVILMEDSELLLVTYDEGSDTWDNITAPHQPVFSSITRDDLDFVLDENDHVHLTGKFIDMISYPFVFVKYFHFDWINWNSETITPSSFQSVNTNRIALDQDGHPAILTLHAIEGHLVLFRYDGGAWSYETIDPNCEVFKSADMVFDRNGMPHIVVQAKPEDIFSQKEQMVVYYNLVAGLPAFHCNPLTLPFGEVWTESFRILPLTIRNDGVAPLVIGGYELSNTGQFKLEGSSFPAYVQPGDSLQLALRFTPAEEVTYAENLRLITNDPANPTVDIPVTGTGISTGSSSILELHVKDTYVDFAYMLINQDDPLEEVEAGLYRNSTPMTIKQFTNREGRVVFAGLTPGSCEVQLFKAAEEGGGDIDCSRTHSFTLGPGYNSLTLTLADSLFHYQVWLSDTLRQIRETDDPFYPFLNYSDAMDEVSARMNVWAGDFDPGMTESLARLLLVETMVHDLFEEGYNLGNEMFRDFGDLTAFVFYSNNWITSILDFILTLIQSSKPGGAQDVMLKIAQMLMEEVVKKEIYQRVTESVMLAGAEVGFPGDQRLMDAWQEIWSKYSSSWDFSSGFGPEQWGSIITEVTRILKLPFIQYVYIEQQTAPKIKKGLDYALDNQYNGTYYEASMKEMNYVSSEKNTVESSLVAARYLRETANTFMITATILNWVGKIKIIPFASIIEQVGFYMKIAAYLEVVTALGISTGKFFVVPSNMGKTVDKIYFPSGKSTKSAIRGPAPPGYKTSRADPLQVGRLKKSLDSENSEYTTVLVGIKDKISSGDKLGAASDILLLREAEREHNNNILRVASPVMAVASHAKDSIESFTPMWDSLKSHHALAGQERFLMYFRLLLAVADTTGDSDVLIMDLIDQNLAAGHRLTEQVADLLDTVTANMEIPAVLIASVTETDKHRLALNETGSVRVVVMNTGAVTAENVYLKVTSNDALEVTGADSLFIGTLSPGQETAELEMTFTCRDEDFELGLWNLLIGSDNARSFPSSGSFVIGDATTSSPFLKKPEFQEFHVIPNPLTGQGMVSYRLEQQARVKISLYDLSGRLLHVFSEAEQGPGRYSMPVSLSSFRPGTYLMALEINGRLSAMEKFIAVGKE